MTKMIKKVLVANRGEIAVRIIRACREMGIKPIAVFSDADRAGLHVRLADGAFHLGASPASESYLDIDKIIAAAKAGEVDAIAPGYGFLAENEEFARRCEQEGLIFIGPSAEAIRKMGDKITSRQIAKKANAPLIPGVQRKIESTREAVKVAESIGFPIMIKASAGGGGKGLRLARNSSEVREFFPLIRSEAKSSFGIDTIYLERYIEKPRHVEIQILADHHGNCVYLGERECSLQRRHQKVVEEAPSPIMTPNLRQKMGEAAVGLAQEVGYRNAGTVEFLVDQEQNFYFLEMNTRLQVEHPVTEMLTGIDLVKAQIRIASGEPLWFSQEDVQYSGWAFECRIYAEDPEHNFVPCPGKIVSLHEPSGPGVRNDNGMYEGLEVTIFYDPLISKLITFAPTREEAMDRMLRALHEFKIGGIKTNIPYFMKIFSDPDFRAGKFDTSFLDRGFDQIDLDLPGEESIGQLEKLAVIASAINYYHQEHKSAIACPESGNLSNWRLAGRRRAMRH